MANYIEEFIPEIWSGDVLLAKEKVHVFPSLANRNYQSDLISAGDTIRINQVGDVTISNYIKSNWGTGLTLQPIDVAQLQLKVDQLKYYTVALDAVDQKQSAVKDILGKASLNAAYQLADTQDAYLAGLYTQAGITSTSNTAAAPVTIASTTIKNECLLMAKEFDEANIQRQERYMVIPPVMYMYLVQAGVLENQQNSDIWTNASVGSAYGWRFYVSNNVSQTSTGLHRIICGVGNESLTWVEQMQETKMVDLVNSFKGFGSAIAGLSVYGARFIPDRTGVLFANIV